MFPLLIVDANLEVAVDVKTYTNPLKDASKAIVARFPCRNFRHDMGCALEIRSRKLLLNAIFTLLEVSGPETVIRFPTQGD